MGSFAEERRLMTVESAISNQGPDQKPDTPANEVSGAWSSQRTRQGISSTQIQGTLACEAVRKPGKLLSSQNCQKWNLILSLQTSLLMQTLDFVKSWNRWEKSRMWNCISGDSCVRSARACSYNHDWKKTSGRSQILYTSGSFALRKKGQMTTFFLLGFLKVYEIDKKKNIWN